MFSLIKYELKGIYKSILGILACIAIVSVFSNIVIPISSEKNALIYLGITNLIVFAIGVATFVIIVLNCIKSLSKYLYGNEGYLLFTTPQSGYSIIGSRLIVSLIQIIVIPTAFSLMVYFGIIKRAFEMVNMKEILSKIVQSVNFSAIALVSLDGVLGIVLLLLTIYFSMILSKSIIPIRKHEGLVGFITFVILNMLIGWISIKLNNSLLIQIPFTPIGANTMNGININMQINNGVINYSLSQFIFNLAASILLFFGSAYLIDNKIEL